MKIGFTGTQKGMTNEQSVSVFKILCEYYPIEVHHGDCVGADEDFHKIAQGCKIYTIIHPPVIDDLRAFCKGNEHRPPKPFIERNHGIVDETEVLIATPKERKEELRSGTWATIRYAYKIGRKILIVWPDGNVSGWKGGG